MTSKEFFKKMAEDSTLAGKMAAAKSPEECYALAKENGLTDSIEEFMATAKELNDACTKLDPSEIDAVVGGGSFPTFTIFPCSIPGLAAGLQ